MYEKKVILKESIREFNKVRICFLKSHYTFNIKQVTDINFETRSDKYSVTVTDGFIELTPSATDVRGYMPDFMRVTEKFLRKLKTGTDITEIEFLSDNKSLKLELPCNPLTDCDNNVVEYSDCPSFEQTENGALRIYAGQSSKSPRRQSVICSDVCKNWDKVLGKNYYPDLLQGMINNLTVSPDCICIELQVYNSRCPVNYANFCFKGYKIYSFHVFLEMSFETEIKLARMKNGRIYVRLQEDVCHGNI